MQSGEVIGSWLAIMIIPAVSGLSTWPNAFQTARLSLAGETRFSPRSKSCQREPRP